MEAMRTLVERWRFGLLAGAGLLLLVIAAFLGYSRYRIRRTIGNLPGRLGATITKEFDGYTYSQSDGKRTIFTLHAAKATQHKDGVYSLHDVDMILYGHAGDRADHISGSDFEYDTKAEVIRAVGIVHLDLGTPAPQNGDIRKHLVGASQDDAAHRDAEPGNRVIHVKTSGLVYTRKLGVAATDQAIEFAFGGFSGHAFGAEYSSDTGHVVLQSAIAVSGLDKDRPVALTCTHGELDRRNSLATLTNAHYSSAGQSAQAELVRIHLRVDGSVEGIEGQRNVQGDEPSQGRVTSDRVDIAISQAGKPTSALFRDRFRFTDDQASGRTIGESAQANLNFDEQGRVRQALLEGGVRVVERPGTSRDPKEASLERTLISDALDLNLVFEGGTGKPQLRDATAKGSAHLTTVARAASGNGSNGVILGTTISKLSADTLIARGGLSSGRPELSTLHGSGHTRVEQVNAQGLDQASSGDTLDATFGDTASTKAAANAKHTLELETANQQGNVSVERRVLAAKAGPPDIQHATAHTASYDAASRSMTLTGDVRVSDSGSMLRASRVAMQQDSGDATADGSVKATYLQEGSTEPVYVLAARATLDHDAGRATFYGRPAESSAGITAPLARMWQAGQAGRGGSQVDAPVLVFEQEAKRLIARAENPGAYGEVHAVLAGHATNSAPTKPPAFKPSDAPEASSAKLSAGVVRISSSQLVYSDQSRQAEFTGGIRVVYAGGEMQASEATAFLAASSPKTSSTTHGVESAAGLLGNSVERIVATHHVEITQPGRRASGDRLVYTASDQMFVLTGTPSVPPRVVDAQQGTTTGAALRFRSGDNSVSISGQDGEGTAGKVHTETRIKQ